MQFYAASPIEPPQFGAFRPEEIGGSRKRLKIHRIKTLTGQADKRTTLDMAKKFMTLDEVVALLEKQRDGRPLRTYASELGVTGQFLCDIFKRRRDPGPKILSKLGLTEIRLYQRTA